MPGLFSGTPFDRPVTCERCEKPLDECRCPRAGAGPTTIGRVVLPKDQPVRVQRERRRDKTVTVIRGLRCGPDGTPDIASFLKLLKTRFGTGGTLTETPAAPGGESAGVAVELQGDHRDKVVEHLRSLGYPAKTAGA
ncbi:MAG: translation initiation factor [Phycisphaerales bacterium]